MLPKQNQGQFVETLVLYLLKTLYMDLIQLNLLREKLKYSSAKEYRLNFGGCIALFQGSRTINMRREARNLIQFGEA